MYRTMYRPIAWLLTAVLLTVGLSVGLSGSAVPANAQNPTLPPPPDALNDSAASYSGPYAALFQIARDQGSVRVIVGLALPTPYQIETAITTRNGVSDQRAAINAAQTGLLSRLTQNTRSTAIATKAVFRTIPYIALTVDEAGLLALVKDPAVRGITLDMELTPQLAQTVPLLDADPATQQSTLGTVYDGSGQTVVIIDNGTETSHPAFGDGQDGSRIVWEACFATNSPANSIESLCGNGSDEQVGPGAAPPVSTCNPALDGGACAHGTHVADTAAGLNGMAPGADIIPIQVFSRRTTDGAQTSFISDTLRALEYVDTDLVSGFGASVINMSLGGGKVPTYCDTFGLDLGDGFIAYDLIVRNLKAKGVATVIAAGNDGFADATTAPACVSEAITVGASNKADQVATSFGFIGGSNSSPAIDLWAPGVDINAAVVGGGTQALTGTSMAAPHVAGAFLLAQEAAPGASVDEILAAFQLTGPVLTDNRNDVKRARPDVDDAIDFLQDGPLPNLATLLINEVTPGTSDTVELVNLSGNPVSLNNWSLVVYNADGSTAGTQNLGGTLNNYTSIVLSFDPNWSGGGAVALLSRDFGADFVRWGASATLPPVTDAFIGLNAPTPPNGESIGRSADSGDDDMGADWTVQPVTQGAQNTGTVVANDIFGGATQITTVPSSFTQTTKGATDQASDPTVGFDDPVCAFANATVWFRFDATENTTLQFTTDGSDYDTVLTVWEGTSLGGLSNVGCNDDVAAGDPFFGTEAVLSSRVITAVEAGKRYYVLVSGSELTADGSLTLNVEERAVPDNDSYTGAIEMKPLPFQTAIDVSLATITDSDPDLTCLFLAIPLHSVWFSYENTTGEPITLDLSASNSDHVVSAGVFSNPPNWSAHECYDGLFGETENFSMTIPAGETRYLYVVADVLLGEAGFLRLKAVESGTVDPIVTSTPTTNPLITPTATLTPDPLEPTPTPTDTPAGELLVNGDFEAETLLGWDVVSSTAGNKVKCNKTDRPNGKPDKIFAFSGDCAFQFKGNTGRSSKLKQNIEGADVSLNAGDILILRGQHDGTQVEIRGKVKLRVKYTDGTATGKLNLTLNGTTTEYEAINGALIVESPAIEKIKVQVIRRAPAGKLFVDDLSLTVSAGGGAPLPPLPTPGVPAIRGG